MPSSIQYSVGVVAGLGDGYQAVELGAHGDYPRATSPAALHVHRLELGLLELRLANISGAASVSIILARDAAGLRPLTAVGAAEATLTIHTLPAIDEAEADTGIGSAVLQCGVEPPIVLEADDGLWLIARTDAGTVDLVAALSWELS